MVPADQRSPTEFGEWNPAVVQQTHNGAAADAQELSSVFDAQECFGFDDFHRDINNGSGFHDRFINLFGLFSAFIPFFSTWVAAALGYSGTRFKCFSAIPANPGKGRFCEHIN